MATRINPNNTPELLIALNRARDAEQRSLAQLASGRRVNAPHDDPAAAAALAGNQFQTHVADQFKLNVTAVRARLQVADGALSSVVSVLTRAITLGVQGANDTNSAQNRQALAQEVGGLKTQLQALANTTFQGTFLFSGTDALTLPFAADVTQPSGIRYDGNAGTNSLEIAPGEFLSVNLPGNQIFTAAGSDVFLAIENLYTALQNGTSGAAIAAATQQLQVAFAHVNTTRAFYGASLNRLETAEQVLDREIFELQREESDLAAADMARVITDLQAAQTARQATMAAVAQTSQLNLFDFLR